MNAPLAGITVIDFTTLAPGPLATLILVNAGAEVTKVERPEHGDELRQYADAFGDNGVTFSMLNAGKRSVVADLKDSQDLERIKAMVLKCDVIVEQFRPGVMARLGLGYEELSRSNPSLIYCSITGFGQHGPKAKVAAHDLNYVADTGLLTIGDCSSGKPSIPPMLASDLAAGSYPAVINILLALQRRTQTGKGTYLDISMTDFLFPLMFWGLGLGWGSNRWPYSGKQLLTGASARYQIYVTADDRYLVVAAIEDRFWMEFLRVLECDENYLEEKNNPSATIEAIASIVRSKTSFHWIEKFAGTDTCTVIANTLEEAVQDAHYRSRGVFDRKIQMENGQLTNALPVPVVAELLEESEQPTRVPQLGEHTNYE